MLNRHLQTEKLIQSSSAVAGELTKIVSKYRYNGSLVYGNTDWTKRFRPANIWAICDMKRCGLVWNYIDHSFTYRDRCKRAPECFAAVNVDAQSWHSPVESVECTQHRVRRRYRRTFFRLTLRFFDDVVNNYFFDSDFKFFDDVSEFSVTNFYVVFIFSSKFMLTFLQWTRAIVKTSIVLLSLFCRNTPLILQFYRAMLCMRGTSYWPVSVGVCLTQVGVLQKQLNTGSPKENHTIAPGI